MLRILTEMHNFGKYLRAAPHLNFQTPFLRRMTLFITPILKSLVVPVIWLALIDAIYSRITPFFALNRIFFPVSEEAILKTKQPIRF